MSLWLKLLQISRAYGFFANTDIIWAEKIPLYNVCKKE
ncbi:Uncharacterized protein dnm_019370 [Desulfonema magnum]|uniref:Uncharacterized protein n=1 Tax=Desulfonema magnum TaxID=45655 RepID=A0A975GLT3_9BACT|nr:Uncharacterized protein dnm_019370 [Desulfonema magnum]